jgi:hypothetical protein
MSIDSKIAEIMEESKLAGLVLENEEIVEEELDEDFITEEEYDSLDEEEQALFELSADIKQRAYVKRYNKSDDESDNDKAQKTLSHIKKREGQKAAFKAAMDADAPPDEHRKQMKRDFLSKESIDVSTDVDALMFGESLSEEFREKAATIFESAVVVRVKEEVARLEEEFEEKLAEQVDSITEGLVEKIDGYLDYVVEQWIEQNEIALENGLKSDIMESFITGMKGLFEEHYIDVPEEKYDVIGEMETRIDVLESKLNEQVERNIDLKKSLSESTRKEIVNMVSEGLTDTETEKFVALVEELSYDAEDTFKVKVQTIRENYFTGKQSALVESFVTDSPVEEIKENKYVNVDPTVAAYAKALQQYNQ